MLENQETTASTTSFETLKWPVVENKELFSFYNQIKQDKVLIRLIFCLILIKIKQNFVHI